MAAAGFESDVEHEGFGHDTALALTMTRIRTDRPETLIMAIPGRAPRADFERSGPPILDPQEGAMSHLTQRVRHIRSQVRRVVFALVIPLTAFALVAVDYARAGEDGLTTDAISRSFGGVPISTMDGIDATDTICTVSPSFNNMPGMSKTFTLGTTQNKPVVVMFDGEWFTGVEGSAAFVQLAIDGVVQSGPSSVVVAYTPFGAIAETETHGFNFISNALTPGTHTAAIQWADNGQGPYCVRVRSMIILHK